MKQEDPNPNVIPTEDPEPKNGGGTKPPANTGGENTPPPEENPGSGSGQPSPKTKEDKPQYSPADVVGVKDTTSAFDYFDQKFKDSDEAKVIDAKFDARAQEASTKSANFVAQNAQKANENYVRNEYQANQTMDKSGWTGGYALDTQRQLDYLKSSIQADIYSQQELQKLGYESSLKQAEMAAEQEKNQLAFQRYQSAQQEAINRANLTGTYIEPHIADMLTQFNAAQSVLSKNADDSKAKAVQEYILKKFNELGVEHSKDGTTGIMTVEGIKTLAAIQAESEAKYKEALAEVENIKIKNAIEMTKEQSPGNVIPYFTEDGKLAGYGSTIPTGDVNKKGSEAYYVDQYFKTHEGSLEKSVNGLLSNIATAYQAALKKDKNLKFEDFMKDKFNGTLPSSVLNTYYHGKDNTIKFDGITVSKNDDGKWVVTDGKVPDPGTPSDSEIQTKDDNGNIILVKDSKNVDIPNDFNGSGKGGSQDAYYMDMNKYIQKGYFQDGDIVTFNYNHNNDKRGLYVVEVDEKTKETSLVHVDQYPEYKGMSQRELIKSDKFKAPPGYRVDPDLADVEKSNATTSGSGLQLDEIKNEGYIGSGSGGKQDTYFNEMKKYIADNIGGKVRDGSFVSFNYGSVSGAKGWYQINLTGETGEDGKPKYYLKKVDSLDGFSQRTFVVPDGYHVNDDGDVYKD